jgi:hypothetical protein
VKKTPDVESGDPVEVEIGKLLKMVDMPNELKPKACELLTKRFKSSGKDSEDLDVWVYEEVEKFLSGPNPVSLKWDKKKWEEWII